MHEAIEIVKKHKGGNKREIKYNTFFKVRFVKLTFLYNAFFFDYITVLLPCSSFINTMHNGTFNPITLYLWIKVQVVSVV